MSAQLNVCVVCGDRAEGKYHGVYSCNACKVFFTRTITNNLTYACKDGANCVINESTRSYCKYCRYQKCIKQGMGGDAYTNDTKRILEAEHAVDTYMETQKDPETNICLAVDKQLLALVEWAKRVPYLTELSQDDQVTLLKTGWNKLVICDFSYRSIPMENDILLATGHRVSRSDADQFGLDAIFDRVMTELVAKMRGMKMDRIELGFLRAIVLFDPTDQHVSAPQKVGELRTNVYVSLKKYSQNCCPDEPNRYKEVHGFLQALRDIEQYCNNHLFLNNLIQYTSIDIFLLEKLKISFS